jgi:hypothetical protein
MILPNVTPFLPEITIFPNAPNPFGFRGFRRECADNANAPAGAGHWKIPLDGWNSTDVRV